MEKIRLDLQLLNKNLVPSRSKANELIRNGKVMVNHKIILKPAFEVDESDNISIEENEILKYVSRGGLKLEKAIQFFHLSLKDLVVLDIGASTGGFTDCALKHGVKKVYSIDVGVNQLHSSLRNHPQVISIENLNFKDISKTLISDKIDLYVCDVSFISIETILLKLKEFDENFTIIILYKPQFEVGKNNINKNGVVKNKKVLIDTMTQFIDFLSRMNIGIVNATYSPILGQKEGNIEFLFYLKNQTSSIHLDIKKLVEEAYKILKVKKC